MRSLVGDVGGAQLASAPGMQQNRPSMNKYIPSRAIFAQEPFLAPPGGWVLCSSVSVGTVGGGRSGIPSKSWVKAQLRSADTKEGLKWAKWEGPGGTGSWYDKGQKASGEQRARWVQYRLALGSANSLSTPRLTRVDVNYATGE